MKTKYFKSTREEGINDSHAKYGLFIKRGRWLYMTYNEGTDNFFEDPILMDEEDTPQWKVYPYTFEEITKDEYDELIFLESL